MYKLGGYCSVFTQFFLLVTVAKAESAVRPNNMEELLHADEVKPVIFKDLAAAFNLSFEQFGKLKYIETKKVHKLINHPVHIIDDEGNLSPSALIPFCDFGGQNLTTGVEVDGFNLPVCNSFKAKVLNDQLCYEVDPNKYMNKTFLSAEEYNLSLRHGVTLYIDTNEDRQTTSKNTEFMIYINTLGRLEYLIRDYLTKYNIVCRTRQRVGWCYPSNF